MEDGVVVTGIGTASAAPDVVHVALGVEARAGSVADSLGTAIERLRRVREALAAAGIADEDVSSGETSLWEEAKRPGVSAYHATLGLSVVCRDVSSAGRVVAEAVAAGGDASRLRGMQFRHGDPAALLREARERAWTDAAGKAEHLAALAGRRLGEVTSVREAGGQGGPRHPRFVPLAASFADTGGGMPELPVEGGTASIAVALEVRWQLGEALP